MHLMVLFSFEAKKKKKTTSQIPSSHEEKMQIGALNAETEEEQTVLQLKSRKT